MNSAESLAEDLGSDPQPSGDKSNRPPVIPRIGLMPSRYHDGNPLRGFFRESERRKNRAKDLQCSKTTAE